MRALARAARTSLSSTHYHFGTKEALLEDVLRRRAEPLNALRLERLDELERKAAGAPVAIEALAEVIVRPLFEVRAARGAPDALPNWQSVRLFFDPAPVALQLRRTLLGAVDTRLLGALARTLPHRTPREIEIAYRLTSGLLAHVAAGHVSISVAAEATTDPQSASQTTEDAAIEQGLLAYAIAGLRALEERESPR